MTTRIEKTVTVRVPVSTAYNQWTQFEEFPSFMTGVERVTQIGIERLEWVAQIAGVRRQWLARIVEQVPDSKVSWAAVEGAVNAGEVTFTEAGSGATTIHLVLEFEPEGVLEILGDKLHLVERQAEGDLERFKVFIESQGQETGRWRGSVEDGDGDGTPGAAEARATRDEESPGTTDPSGTFVAAGSTGAVGGSVGEDAPVMDEADGSMADMNPGTAGTQDVPAPAQLGSEADSPTEDEPDESNSPNGR